jgi:hypothetical protein
MTARLCMYKGPATGLLFQLAHWAICLVTRSKYSHVELEINGVCYSSSFRDGGVRAKVITDLDTSGHFDMYPITCDEQAALGRWMRDGPKPYDWLGMLRVCPELRWLPRINGKRFCSEEVAYMLGLIPDPETLSPQTLLETAQREGLISMKGGALMSRQSQAQRAGPWTGGRPARTAPPSTRSASHRREAQAAAGRHAPVRGRARSRARALLYAPGDGMPM